MTAPIKRHTALQPFSHDHHHALLLCWKIREGLKRNVSASRISDYVRWFWNEQLAPHFAIEEKYIFPVLGNDHIHVRQALDEHRRIESLFQLNDVSAPSLKEIADTLDDHIRFEERTLFNEIQKAATPEQLKLIEEHHSAGAFCDDWKDEFWK
jgi:hypothetical protein